jgi:hypothetical protein
MFAGMQIYGKVVPNEVFSDAYVIGFLQQIVIHAVNANYGGKADAKSLISATKATMDRLKPGFGKQLVPVLMEVNEPTHPAHLNYMVGQRVGREYVKALIEDDKATMQDCFQQFRAFIKRNYLGIDY